MRRALAVVPVLVLGAAGTGVGQLAPPGTGGVAALVSALRSLGAEKRVLVIGAHPDDEDNELLTLLSRGLGAQTAYLSLNRGEGGQNVIGSELGPELGVLRSEELLAARRVDGARQYFTRAYDFGFSKTADETWRFWPRDSLVADVVAVMRRFRPQVVVSIFSGTPRDGHGHHQVAGLLAHQAFEMLRDSSWGPVKLYRSARFDTAGASVTLQGGRLDPVAGRSYRQLAAVGRSQHRSQATGQLQPPGPSAIRLALWERRGSAQAPDRDFFAGVDTVLRGRRRYVALIDSARAALNPLHPQAIAPLLARALAALGEERERGDADRRATLERALADAAGLAIDGVADDWIVIGGQRLQVDATIWNAGDSVARIEDIQLVTPPGWAVERPGPAAGSVAPGTVATRAFFVTVAADADRSQPYFLRRPRTGAGGGGLYDWSAVPPELRGLPFEPPPLELRVRLSVAGARVTLEREVSHRSRDEVNGEIRRPVLVDCAYDVAIAPDLTVWPQDGAASGSRRFTVTVTNHSRGRSVARLAFTTPPGWPAIPADSLAFEREDEARSLAVALTLPAGIAPGVYELSAAAETGGRRCEGALRVIDYPHIRPRAVVRPSSAEIRVARIALPALSRVGYVRGAADRVPEALAAVGVPIDILDADSLSRGSLSRYDAIVIGSRAYEIDPTLVASNDRLLDYARAGGLVIVQYQQYPFVQSGIAPYPLSIARPHDRVTDETAPVALLQPSSPVFHVPNEIGPADWQGWVQERGLYFAHDWDSAYTPLLEMHDSGDPPLQGGLLVARVGKGTYVYTGLAFFRQLPAGVPGAYRLFANLLALKRPDVR